MVAEPKRLRPNAKPNQAASRAVSLITMPSEDAFNNSNGDDSFGEVRRFLFDVETYHRLGEADIFAPDTRTELFEGEIIVMSPIGKRHAAKVKKTVIALRRIKEKDAIISVQDPLIIPHNRYEPVPDVMLLKPRPDAYENEPPRPEDVLLLIEISDSTLNFDRQKKLPLYARYGVCESWLVNLIDNVIEIYTESKNGKYTMCRIAQKGEKMSPLAFPKLKISVDAILG